MTLFKQVLDGAVILNRISRGGGGGGGNSALPQIVFFINSVSDAAETQNLVTFAIPYNLLKIIKVKDVFPESRDMTIFGKSTWQRVVKLH